MHCGQGFQLEEIPAEASVQWSIRPFRVVGPVSFNLLAVWTRREPPNTYVEALDSALNAYGPLLRGLPLVVLGDFNANAIWDNPRRRTDFTRLAGRLRTEFGLVSAYHKFFSEAFGDEARATHYYRWHQHEPFHLDYCFAPESWPILSVEVSCYEDWSDISDHRPLVVEFGQLG